MSDKSDPPPGPKPPARQPVSQRAEAAAASRRTRRRRRLRQNAAGAAPASAYSALCCPSCWSAPSIGLGGFAAALLEINSAGPLAEDKVVLLTREDDGGPIGDQLERAGVIDSATLFSAMTCSMARAAGSSAANTSSRRIRACATSRQLLLSHKVVQHKFSVPEGLTSEQIVQRLRDDDVLAGDVKEIAARGLAAAGHLFLRARRDAQRAARRAWPRRRPSSSTRSGRSARPTCRSSRRANS